MNIEYICNNHTSECLFKWKWENNKIKKRHEEQDDNDEN